MLTLIMYCFLVCFYFFLIYFCFFLFIKCSSFSFLHGSFLFLFSAFYYLSFRVSAIKERYQKLFLDFRDYLTNEFRFYKKAGIINVADPVKAADMVVILIEGLEFHAGFLKKEESFEVFADYSKQVAIRLLKKT